MKTMKVGLVLTPGSPPSVTVPFGQLLLYSKAGAGPIGSHTVGRVTGRPNAALVCSI